MRFVADGNQLAVFTEDQTPFHTFVELGELQLENARRAEEAEHAVDEERRRAERAENAAMTEARRARAQTERADAEKERADAEKERADRLAERLRQLGVDPGAE